MTVKIMVLFGQSIRINQIASFELFEENEMRKCFNWVKFKPRYSIENNLKGSKISHHSHLLQQIIAKNFSKLNEEGLNLSLQS